MKLILPIFITTISNAVSYCQFKINIYIKKNIVIPSSISYEMAKASDKIMLSVTIRDSKYKICFLSNVNIYFKLNN